MHVKTHMGVEQFQVDKGFPGIPRNHGTAGSCSKSAENRAASSLWVGGHHYKNFYGFSLERFEVEKYRAFSWISWNSVNHGNCRNPGNPS